MKKLCKICGVEIDAGGRNNKKYCEECRKKVINERALERNHRKLGGIEVHRKSICVYCKKVFIGAKANQKYCCDEHRYEHHNEKKRKYPLRSRDKFICELCGKEFEPNKFKKTTQRFCSKQCQDKAWSRHRDTVGIKSYTYTCRYCGKEYHPKAKDRNIYCSRACRYKHQKEQARGTYYNNTGYAIGDCSKVYFNACVICGKSYIARNKASHCCSNQCKKEYEYQRQLIKHKVDKSSRKCKECNREFTPSMHGRERTFCSQFCSKKYSKRIGKSTRRAKIKNVRREPFDPLYIFKRDKYKCRICGAKTPLKYRGTYSNKAPELDHIIPLSLGGEHTKRNTQCVCRQCNQTKSNGYVKHGEQLFLFG